jgi:uncharacterized membrane protein
MGPTVTLATTGDVIRLTLILLLVALVGIGPLVVAFLRHIHEPDVQKPYRDHHDELALARHEWRRGRLTEAEYRTLEQHMSANPDSLGPVGS